jgi:hypothetical protein
VGAARRPVHLVPGDRPHGLTRPRRARYSLSVKRELTLLEIVGGLAAYAGAIGMVCFALLSLIHEDLWQCALFASGAIYLGTWSSLRLVGGPGED